jgi:predicted Zn-dependent protease with MMP-like domain/thioredoxin-like negative regulator of GroEL
MSRQDRLFTLVDRGLELCDAGDLDGAARQLAMARRIDPAHVDVTRLEAALAAAEGDSDRALALFEELAGKLPDDATPWISVAHVHFYSRGDAAAALAALDRALELVDDEDALIDAVLVKADVLIAEGRTDEATGVLGELASSAIDDPATALEIADAHLGAADPDGALRWTGRIPASSDLATDAMYAAGCAHELRGDDAARSAAWLEVRRRDAEAPWPAWHLDADAFEKIAEQALAELPARARELLADVPMLIDDLPAEGIVADGFDPRAFGLIDGPNLIEQATEGRGARPVNIFLYQKNLEAAFEHPDELAEQIRITVLHETAHYFGLDEDEVAALGLE